MSEEMLTRVLLGCLGVLLLKLISRLEKGNETLVSVSKDVAVILVELKAYGKRIDKAESDISTTRQRTHDLANDMGQFILKYDNLSERVSNIKDKVHDINNELHKLNRDNAQ